MFLPEESKAGKREMLLSKLSQLTLKVVKFRSYIEKPLSNTKYIWGVDEEFSEKQQWQNFFADRLVSLQ